MQNNNYVGFGQVVDPNAQEMARVIKNREQAKALYNEGLAPSQGQMVGGRYIRPALGQEIAKAIKAYAGWQMGKDADTQEKQMIDTQNKDYNDTLSKYAEVLKTGDRDAAMGVLAESKNPALKQMYVQQLLSPMEKAKYSTTPHFDQAGKAYILSDSGGVKYLDGIQSRDKMENWNGRVVNPYAVQQGAVINDPNKPFMLSADGRAVPNSAYQNYELAKSRAGASNISMSTGEKNLFSNLGEGIAKDIMQTKKAADSARASLAKAADLRRIIMSDKVLSGPFANERMYVLRLGQQLGIVGKGDNEKLANTREVIQGLARQELEAAQMLQGQGQVSNAERELVARASGGNITYSKPELLSVLNAIEKIQRLKIEANNRNVERLRSNPNSAQLVDFLDQGPIPGQEQQPQAVQSAQPVQSMQPSQQPAQPMRAQPTGVDEVFKARVRKYL